MTQTITISTHLAASPDQVWKAVQYPRLLHFVSHPILRFTPVDPPVLPDRWDDGDFIVKMHLLGFFPLGRQTIGLSKPPMQDGVRFIRDNGHGPMIRRWDHLISIAPEGEGTRYTDQVHVDAGLLTPIVATFARVFYRSRQRRWRKLVASGFDYGRFES